MRTSAARTPRSALLTAVLAAVVTLGAIGAVFLLRPRPAEPSGAAEPAAAPVPPVVTCGGGPCRQVAAMTVGGVPVVLLTDASGGSARVRVGPEPGTVFELAIAQLGVRLDQDSLRCIDGAAPACLIRGDAGKAAYGELLVASGGVWRDPGKPYFSDAGTLSLYDVTADGRPDVIVVRHDCPGAEPGTPKCDAAPVLGQVYDLAGRSVGCTRRVTSPSDLRGWPDIRLTRADLRPCPA
ncbi:hypothetical protein [Amycolatopsis australiensis]|uniref:Uncharacterized protein n=1 Tax=Amycolatopsis australiensis TaxID=546364 RepID=A0A1K1P7M7_9PSEU|nr:hypothetical protein [Amycolatopsis australiensis]SFW43794.1 hypothetical protein SAMN04489730_0329 [Amycolatopsis australiensis]